MNGDDSLRGFRHPLVMVAWSVLVMIVYALFPSSDVTAVIALLVWGFGVVVWMIASDADSRSDVQTMLRDLRP